jgi:ornithine cyclodeaminase/alanine dehydrogenase-like protein (mu-crystallin family)
VAGKLLARLRTGAASGVSAAALAHRGPITLASVGAGYQAWTQVEAVSRVREISALRVWSRTRDRAERFAAQIRDGLGLPATAAATVAAAVAGADVVTAATKARDPIVLGRDIAPGTHVVLAGSSHADRREADSELFRRAGAVYADDVDLARAHSGDVRTAVGDGALAWDDVQHLGAALEEPESIPSGNPSTVFCSHGVGSWDLELAMIAVDRAEAAGVGHRLDLDMGQWRGGM